MDIKSKFEVKLATEKAEVSKSSWKIHEEVTVGQIKGSTSEEKKILQADLLEVTFQSSFECLWIKQPLKDVMARTEDIVMKRSPFRQTHVDLLDMEDLLCITASSLLKPSTPSYPRTQLGWPATRFQEYHVEMKH